MHRDSDAISLSAFDLSYGHQIDGLWLASVVQAQYRGQKSCTVPDDLWRCDLNACMKEVTCQMKRP